ncbi:MAG TPA: tail-specific protease [Planctomycetaceae bacterium]|nr:tail-specific protease [Planctomycetaceae bacterium]
MRHCRWLASRSVRSLLMVSVLITVVTFGFWGSHAAELDKPTAKDRRVTLLISSLIQRQHLSKHALDDEISGRAIKTFFKTIDPLKLYFLQTDIDEFMKQRDKIDDMIKKGDVSIAYTIYNRYLERVDERVEMALELIKETHDFTADEYMISKTKKMQYAKNTAAARERWRKRIKFNLLSLKSEKVEGEKAQERLTRRYTSYGKQLHQTSGDDLLEMFLTSVTSSFDPHTTYFSPPTLENFQIQMRLKLEGIGAQLQMSDGFTRVTKIIPGGAADKQGDLKPEDRIVSVGQGEEGDMVDVVDMKLQNVVKLIRGKSGTIVRLGVTPKGSNERKVYKITRAKIALTDSEARSEILETSKKADGSPYRIGVIVLPSFYMDMEGARKGLPDFKSTTRDVRRILDKLNEDEKGIDAIVLDLSQNGGGSLTEAINLTGLFINSGTVVQVRDPSERVQQYDDTDASMTWKGPLVVVTSKFSASASEILAGAIQDYNRGVIVGDKATHGKGTVQSLLDLGSQLFGISNPPNLGALKLTMQQFYRPDGDSTQRRGVLADVVLPAFSNHMDVGEEDLDYSLKFNQVKAAKHDDFQMTSKESIEKLRKLSSQRRAKSEDFKKLAANIEKYKEQRSRDKITLNEKAFFKQRESFDADKEDEKRALEQNKDTSKIFPLTFYNKEVLAVTVDYLKGLGDHKIAQLQP